MFPQTQHNINLIQSSQVQSHLIPISSQSNPISWNINTIMRTKRALKVKSHPGSRAALFFYALTFLSLLLYLTLCFNFYKASACYFYGDSSLICFGYFLYCLFSGFVSHILRDPLLSALQFIFTISFLWFMIFVFCFPGFLFWLTMKK